MPTLFLVEGLRWFWQPLTLGTMTGVGAGSGLGAQAFDVATNVAGILGSILAGMAAIMALGMPTALVLFVRATR